MELGGLLTPKSFGQGQPPETQNRLILQEIRRFFFTFCLQRFLEKLRDFAKLAVDPNCAPYGIKTRPGRGIFASGPPVFSFSDVALSIGPFLCHGIRLLCNDKCHGKIARAYGHSYQMVRKELPATALSLCIAYQSLMGMRSIFISPPFCPVSKAILHGDPRTQMEPGDDGC